MPWAPPSAAGPGAGSTTGDPWLPVDATAERRNVASQLGDPRSMLSLYRALLALRRTRPSPQSGSQEFLDAPRDVLAYLRTGGGERTLVVLDFAAAPRSLDIAPASGRRLPAATGDAAGGPGSTLVLGPLSGVVVDPGRDHPPG